MISEELKIQILTKAGLKTITPRDCKAIAAQITKATNRYISTSTIKRIFGFAHVIFFLSKYTTTTLKLYVKCDLDFYFSTNSPPDIPVSIDLSYLPPRNLEGNMKIESVIIQERDHALPLKTDHYLHAEQLVFTAISIMTKHRYTSLPVYEYGKCIGIIDLTELLSFIEAKDLVGYSLRYHKLNFDLRSALLMIQKD